jgi:hypothetical protein
LVKSISIGEVTHKTIGTNDNNVGRLRNEEIVPGGSSLQRILVRLKTLSDNREGVQVDLLSEDIDVVYDMLSRMLELSPVRRATAEELLKHEWLNGI